jgi:hypothetical protein
VRSRCARIRLGPVGLRDVEAILSELGAADAPTAARLGRLAGGRPGVALAYARGPSAAVGRGEVARTLLDLLRAPRARRLSGIREALAAAGEVASTLAGGRPPAASEAEADVPTPRLAPAERRRAMTTLLDIWRDVARDLRLVQLGEVAALRDPGLLEDLFAAAPDVPPAGLVSFLDRLTRAGELLVSNVSPELIADALALAWPEAAPSAVPVGPGRPAKP